ncbi:hypothetical protein DFS34DRAFT_595167 [Phlyctochytrium arcticum]|nr:hypothetical protein DFS34DRAFT_595167 [Phlyctochytrium arcticum]
MVHWIPNSDIFPGSSIHLNDNSISTGKDFHSCIEFRLWNKRVEYACLAINAHTMPGTNYWAYGDLDGQRAGRLLPLCVVDLLEQISMTAFDPNFIAMETKYGASTIANDFRSVANVAALTGVPTQHAKWQMENPCAMLGTMMAADMFPNHPFPEELLSRPNIDPTPLQPSHRGLAIASPAIIDFENRGKASEFGLSMLDNSVWMPTGPASEGGKTDVINVVATILNDKTSAVLEEDGTYLAVGHARVDKHGTGLQVESLQPIPTLMPPTAHASPVGTVKTITETTLTLEYEAYDRNEKVQVFLELRAWKKGGWKQELATLQTGATVCLAGHLVALDEIECEDMWVAAGPSDGEHGMVVGLAEMAPTVWKLPEVQAEETAEGTEQETAEEVTEEPASKKVARQTKSKRARV